MTNPTTDRTLTDGQVAWLLGIAAVVVAAVPVVIGASGAAVLGGTLLAFLLVVAALGVSSDRAEYGEPPRRTG